MNTSMYRVFGRPSPAGWEGAVKLLREALLEQERVWNIMTTYERQSIGESIAEMRERYRPMIEAGAVGNKYSADKDLKAALAVVDDEKRKIINSWDATRLAAEMQVAEMRVNQAVKGDAGHFDLATLQAIYQEAQDSGDRYKQRAVAEAMQSLVSKVPAGSTDTHGEDMRLVTNRMERQAQRDLEALKNSEGLAKANEIVELKFREVKRAEGVLDDVGHIMGDIFGDSDIIHNDAIEKAMYSVRQDEEGNFVFSG